MYVDLYTTLEVLAIVGSTELPLILANLVLFSQVKVWKNPDLLTACPSTFRWTMRIEGRDLEVSAF